MLLNYDQYWTSTHRTTKMTKEDMNDSSLFGACKAKVLIHMQKKKDTRYKELQKLSIADFYVALLQNEYKDLLPVYVKVFEELDPDNSC